MCIPGHSKGISDLFSFCASQEVQVLSRDASQQNSPSLLEPGDLLPCQMHQEGTLSQVHTHFGPLSWRFHHPFGRNNFIFFKDAPAQAHDGQEQALQAQAYWAETANR